MKITTARRFARLTALAGILSTVVPIATAQSTPSAAARDAAAERSAKPAARQRTTRPRAVAVAPPTVPFSIANSTEASVDLAAFASLLSRVTSLLNRSMTPAGPQANGSGSVVNGGSVSDEGNGGGSIGGARTRGFSVGGTAAFTWTGGSAVDSNWTTGANWGGVAPGATSAADLTFAGTTRLSPTIDAAFTVNSLTFAANAGAFTLGGGTLSILTIGAGGITQSSTTNLETLSNAQVTLSAGQTWNVAAGGLLVNAPITGAFGITKTGTGTLTLNASSTYTGGTTVTAGILDATNDRGLGAIPTSAATPNLTLNGGTFQWGNTFNITAKRTISLGASGGTLDTQAFVVSDPGLIVGVGSLTKIGTGMLTLTGLNTFSGGTTISAGILNVNADTALGTAPASPAANLTIGAGTLQIAAAFTLNANRNVLLNATTATIDTNGFSLTIPGIVSGNVLNKVGTGTLTLSGVNTYASTVINAGTVNVANEAALGAIPATASTNITLNGGTLQWGCPFSPNVKRNISIGSSGGTLDLNGFNVTIASVISGSGALISLGTGTLTLTGVNTYTGNTTITGGTVALNGDTSLGASGSTLTLTLNAATLQFLSASTTLSAKRPIAVTGGSTFDIGANNATIAGVISGTGGLTFKGTGTLTLSGSNTYSGGTVFTIAGSMLNINADAALGSAATLALSNNTLQFGGSNVSLSGSRPITLGGTNVTIDTQTFSGTIAGVISGAASLTTTGTGTLTLSGANTYTGGTVINGTVKASADSAFGATSGGLTFNNGTFIFGGAFSFNAARAITLSGTTNTFNTGTNAVTIANVISGSGGLAKAGTGTLTLTGANTYTGGTTVSAGFLAYSTAANVGNVGTAGGSSAVVVANAATVWDTATFTQAFLNTVDTGSTGTIAIGNGIAAGVSLDFSAFTGASLGAVGTQTLAATNLITPNGTTYRLGGGGGTLTVASLLSGARNLIVGNSSSATSGVVSLTGLNTYTGGTTIIGGTLSVGSSTNLGTLGGVSKGSVAINTGTILSSTSLISQSFIDLATASSSGVIALGVGGTNNANLDFSGLSSASLGATGTFTYSGILTPNGTTYRLGGGGGTLTFSSLLSGANSLAVNGSLVLSNTANTYTGSTTVNSGTLQIAADGNLGAPTAFSASNITIGNATLQFNAAIPWNAYRGITLTSSSSTLNIGTGLTQIITQPITGAGGLTKAGAGTLELNPSSADTFTGSTNISAGTLQYDSEAAMGSTTNSIILANGTTAILNFVPDAAAMPLFSSSSGTGVIVLGTPNAATPLTQALSFAGAGNASLGIGASLTYNGALTPSGTTYRLYAGTLTSGYTFTIGSLLTGTNALTVNSNTTTPGTVVLTGANTYSGATTISAGTLQAVSGNTSAFGTNSTITLSSASSTLDLNSNNETIGALSGTTAASKVLLGNGAQLTLANTNGSNSFSGIISGTGILVKTGGATQTLSGANTFTGPATVNGGTLNFGSLASLGGINAITLANPGTLETSFALTQSVLDLINAGGAATGTVSLGASSASALNFSALNLAGLSLGASVASTYSGTLTPNGTTYRLGGGGSTLTFSSTLSGANSLVVDSNGSGAGTVILSNANTYTGATALNAGTLQAASGNTSAFGVNSAVTFSSSAATTLDFNNNNETLGALAGGISSSTLKLGTGQLTVGGLNTNTLFAGVITGSATASQVALNKVGTGLLELSAVNTYTGKTVIDAGTLQFDQAKSLGGSNNGVGAVTVNYGGTAAAGYALDQSGLYKFSTASTGVIALAANSANSLDLSTDGAGLNAVSLGAVGNVVFSGTLNPYGATYRLGGGGGTLTVSKALADGTAGTTNLLVDVNGTSSAGTVILGSANTISTYSGGTTVNAGTLQIASDTNLGAIPTSPTAANFTFGGGILQAGANVTLSPNRGVQINSVGGTIDTQSYTTTVSGVVAGSGALTKIGSGTLALTGTNTYTGVTNVNGGTLQISSDANLGTAPSSPVAGDLTLRNATLQFTGAATLSANRGLNFSSSVDTIDTQSNNVTIAGGVAGTAAFNKIGSGTLTLSGANTYTGSTTVSAGTLALPSGANTSVLSVASGATLAAGGTVNALSLASGSVLSPTSTVNGAFGTLNATTATVADGSIFNFDLGAASGSDLLNLSGAFAYDASTNGPITFAFDMPFTEINRAGDTFTLVTFNQNATGAAADDVTKFVATPRHNLTGLRGSFGLTLASGGNPGKLTYTITSYDALPEPSALALLTLGGGLSLGALRRRQRSNRMLM